MEFDSPNTVRFCFINWIYLSNGDMETHFENWQLGSASVHQHSPWSYLPEIIALALTCEWSVKTLIWISH